MKSPSRSIIDIILENQEKTAEAKLDGKRKVITTEEFFESYCSKEQFTKLLSECDENDLKSLDYLLQLMHKEQKFEVTPFEKLDVNKHTFIWVNIRNKNTTSGFKVLTAGNMCQLIGIYGFGLITSKLTLEGLYKGISPA